MPGIEISERNQSGKAEKYYSVSTRPPQPGEYFLHRKRNWKLTQGIHSLGSIGKAEQ